MRDEILRAIASEYLSLADLKRRLATAFGVETDLEALSAELWKMYAEGVATRSMSGSWKVVQTPLWP